MASPPTAASSADRPGLLFPPGAPRLAMVAGETSGDLLAGLLLQAMRQRWPALAAAGCGCAVPERVGRRRVGGTRRLTRSV